MSASDWLTDFKSGATGGGSGNTQNRALPPGWEQGFDNKSGRIYYFNRLTQQSSWDVPSADMVIPPSQGGQSASRSGQQVQQRGGGGDMSMQRGNMQMKGDGRGGQSDSRAQGGQSDYRGGQQSGQGRGGFDVSTLAQGQRYNSSEDNSSRQRGGGSSENYERRGYKGDSNRNDRNAVQESRQSQEDASWNNYRGNLGGGKEGKGWGKGDSYKESGSRYDGARSRQRDEGYSERQSNKWDEGKKWEQEEVPESTGNVSIARQGYDDDNLPSDKGFTRRVANAEEVNLAENLITGAGLQWILRPISSFPHLRVVKMHKNQIGDSAANSIVKLCRNSPALNELHLSHNQLTWVGADKIVPAACERQILKNIEGADPSLWLRLEMNQVEDAKTLFADWQRRGLMVTLYHKSDQHTPPGVILPYFMSQRVPGGQRDEWEEKSWSEGWRGQRAAAAEWWAADSGSWASWNKGGGYDDWGSSGWSQSSKGKGKGKAATQALGDWSWSGGKEWQPKEAKGKGKKQEKEGYTEKKKGGGKGASGNKGITDETLEEFCKTFAEEHKDEKVLDISSNKLSGEGFSAFQDLCLELASLQIVKLHKNLLTDAAAPALAEICRKCPALCELHLSHNLITKTGAEEIVAAAAEGRKAGDEEGLPPLWLRLEYNEIETPQECVDDWKSRELSIKTYPKAPSRHNLSKGVHLPFFLSQGKPSGYVHGENERGERKEYYKKEAIEEYKQEWVEKPQKAEKKTQLKWKVKVAKKEGEEEENEEEEKDDAEVEDDKKEESEKKESKKDKKSRQRQAAEDDDGQERTAFDDEGESDGSNGA